MILYNTNNNKYIFFIIDNINNYIDLLKKKVKTRFNFDFYSNINKFKS